MSRASSEHACFASLFASHLLVRVLAPSGKGGGSPGYSGVLRAALGSSAQELDFGADRGCPSFLSFRELVFINHFVFNLRRNPIRHGV